MRRAAKIDDNQTDIVKEYRNLGASVTILSAVGEGCPDIAVGYRGVTLFIEIKDGNKPPSQQQLTSHQEIWHRRWHGSVEIQNSVEQCIVILQKMKNGEYS